MEMGVGGEGALRKDVLIEKYGVGVTGWMEDGDVEWPRHTSRWWKDIVNLDTFGGQSWFNPKVVRRVGNGGKTSLWKDIWRGEVPFYKKYSCLFLISNHQEASVGELMEGNDVSREWNLTWYRQLFVWEEQLFGSLLTDLEGFEVSQEEDVWKWRLVEGGNFSVKSSYDKFEGLLLLEEDRREEENKVFTCLWRSLTPSKVVAFS